MRLTRTAAFSVLAAALLSLSISGACKSDRGDRHRARPRNPYPDAPAVEVTVTSRGFDPPRVFAKRGIPSAIAFTREDEAACASGVEFPELEGLRVELPMDRPVRVSFLARTSNELHFLCASGSFRGTVIVE
jgi:plastocyanin domain-containing protein